MTLDHSPYPGDNLEAGETLVSQPSTATALVDGQSSATALELSAPGDGNTGQLDLRFNVDSWLRYDWNGGGDVSPQGQVTFGRYRGHDRVIYWKEQFSQ